MGDVLSGHHQMRGGSGSVCAPRHRSWLSALHGDTSVRLWSWLSGLTQSGLVHLSLRIFSPPRCSCFLLYNASLFPASGPLHLPSPTARMTLVPFPSAQTPHTLQSLAQTAFPQDGFLCPASVTRALALLHHCLTSSTPSVCWRQTLIFIRLFYFIYWRKAMVGRREIFL